MPRLSVLHAGRVERSVALTAGPIRIGRLPGLELTLPGRTVSRTHARIVAEGDAFVVEDLGSVNGIRIRDDRVIRRRLQPGDPIAIEDYVVIFEPPADVFEEGLRAVHDQTAPRGYDMTYLSGGRFAAREDVAAAAAPPGEIP